MSCGRASHAPSVTSCRADLQVASAGSVRNGKRERKSAERPSCRADLQIARASSVLEGKKGTLH
jgi:hypothetical protein